MDNLEPASELLARWIAGTATAADERDLYDNGEITDCEYEFGPHNDHSDCERIMAGMVGYADDDPNYDIEYQSYMYGSSRY